MTVRRSVFLLGLCFVLSVYASAQACSYYNSVTNYTSHLWTGVHNHISGSHWETYNPQDGCTYTNPSSGVVGAPCNTMQFSEFIFTSPGDNGTINTGVGTYHQLDPKTETYSAQRTGSGTPAATYTAGIAVDLCNSLGCPTITFTLNPFSASGGGVIEESGTFIENSPGCPTHLYYPQSGGCTCRDCGCGSPLVMDASGIGPFKNVVGNGDNFYQFTGLDAESVMFKMKMQHGSWDDTPLQRVAWTKPGGTMLLLVLPNEQGKVETGDDLFGNVTHCGAALCHDGFEALKYKCDNSQFGGNNDGFCDSQDSLYYRLRWLAGRPDDPNAKMYTMAEISPNLRFDLRKGTYYELKRPNILLDTHGNEARYQGVVRLGTVSSGTGVTTLDRPLWDVWLLDDIHKEIDVPHR